eukprot:1004081-Rhodomonas_salina.3
MFGTDIAYGPSCLLARYAMPGTDRAYGPICLTRALCDVRCLCAYARSTRCPIASLLMTIGLQSAGPFCLHARYVMPGTDSVWSHARNAVSGIDIAYGTTRRGSDCVLQVPTPAYHPTHPLQSVRY